MQDALAAQLQEPVSPPPDGIETYLELLGRRANSGSFRQQEQNPGPLPQSGLDGPSLGPRLELIAFFGCQRQGIGFPHPILPIFEMRNIANSYSN
jgi:hypothetical protein